MDLIPSFTGSFWSLSTEVQFYVICPLIFLLISRFNNFKSRLIILGLLGLINFYIGIFLARLGSKIPEYPKSFFYYFVVFVFGIFLQLLFLKLPKIKITYTQSNVFFSLICFLLYIYVSCTHYFYIINGTETRYTRWIYPIITCLIGGLLIYLAELFPAQAKKIQWSNIIKRPAHTLEIFGILSYGFYLWHGEILQFLRKVIGDQTNVQLAMISVASFILSIVASTVTYYFIEKKVKIFDTALSR